ncbi:MAG: hypothetical protein JRJ85_14030 [Deltaproteobacteria bacterium]|nr:hypothetical protein [Deltaproteobacteria bacterium]
MEILQLNEIILLLMAFEIWHFHGIMERWNIAILGRADVIQYNGAEFLKTHYAIVPLFQHSNWGGAPEFKKGGISCCPNL